MSFPSRDDVAGGHDHCDALTQRRVKAISRIGRGDSIVRDGVRVPIEALIGNASETHQNGEARLAELARHLADAKPTCRIQSLRAIARIAPIGHPVATAKAVMHLQDNDHAVRCEAIETLSRIAARGDRVVVGTLIDALGGESTLLRNPVQPGDYRDFTRPNGALSRAPRRPAAHVGFTTADLKIAALRALGTIAGEGDVRAVACLVRLAEDWDEQVQDAAATILVAMGKSGLAEEARATVRMRRYEKNKCSRNVAAVPEACTELRRALPLCARDRVAQESLHTKDVGRRHRMQGWPGTPCARVPQGPSW